MSAIQLLGPTTSIANGVDSLVTLSPGALAQLNTGAQLAAAAAGLLSVANPTDFGTAISAGLGAATIQTAKLIQDSQNFQNGTASLTDIASDVVGIIGDAAIVGGAVSTALGFEGAGQAFTVLGSLTDIASIALVDPNDLINAAQTAANAASSASSAALNALSTFLNTAAGALENIINATPSNQSTVFQNAVSGIKSSANQTFPTIANSGGVSSISTGVLAANGTAQTTWTDPNGGVNTYTTAQSTNQSQPEIDSALTNAEGSGTTTSTTTQLFDSTAGSAPVAEVTSTPDASGNGGFSLRFISPEEAASLNGSSIDPTQVTPTGNGAFTFGSPQADPAGLKNQLTINGTFGTAGLTVVDPTTGVSTTVPLNNGSTTDLQEGRSVATGQPNEQAQSTQSNGQVDDTVFGQGAQVQGNNEDVTLAPGASAGVAGNYDVIALANGSGSSLGLTGTGDTVASTGNIINVNGVASTATINGTGDTINVGATSQTVTATGSGDTINMFAGANYDTVNASSDIVNASTWTNSNLVGNGNTLNMSGTGGPGVGIIGTGDVINAQDDVFVNYNAGTTLTVNGSKDAIDMQASNQTLDTSGSGSNIYVATGDSYDSIQANGDNIYATDLLSSNLYGSNDALVLGGVGGSTIGIIGNDDYVFANSDIIVPYDASTALVVYGSGDSIAASASDQTIYVPDAGSYVYVGSGLSNEVIYATGSTIIEGEGDSVDVIGSNDGVYGDSSDYNEGIGENNGDEGGGGDGGGYGYGYGGYDFAAGSPALSGGTGTDVGLIAQYDRTVAHDLAAAAVADHARTQAEVATQTAAQLGTAFTTPEFEGAKWQNAGNTGDAAAPGQTITWSFATSAGNANDPFSSFLDAEYKATVEKAVQAWATASGLTFEEVPDSTTSDIRIGWGDFDTSSTGVLGYTDFQQTNGAIQSGVIIRLEDPSETALATDPNGQAAYAGTGATLYQVALHEIGRAIGLADTADPNSVMFASASSSNQTLDQTDIAGVQTLYGAPVSQDGTTPAVAPQTTAVTPAMAASSSIDVTATSYNQIIQALAGMPPQTSMASTPVVAQTVAQDQTLAAAVQ